MKSRFVLVVAASLVLAGAGCDKKQPPTNPTPPSASASGASNASETTPAPAATKPASGNPLNAPADYVGTVANAQNVALKQVDLASVGSAIQQFNASEGRFPKDLNELIAEGYLVKIPATPRGTQLEYDPKQGTVRLVRK